MTKAKWVTQKELKWSPGVAFLLIFSWVSHLILVLRMDWDLKLVVFHVALQTFLSTGLFITAHDAMHGSAAPLHPRLNRALGVLSAFLYGGFQYSHLLRAHRKHHEHPVTCWDPDYTSDPAENPFRWFLQFGKRYFGWREFLTMCLHVGVLLGLSQGSWSKVIVFFAIPSWLSAIQLFYFGTYLPHRQKEGQPFLDRHRARSNDFPVWLSFLTCYHFGYHHEHHLNPSIPWWRLPRARAQSRSVT